MSKLSFRARALDPSKPMPIYLAEELPDLPEYSAINRAVPQMPSGMEKEEESEHHLQRAICAGLIIPTPEVFETECEFYDRSYPSTYKMPRQMIHMQPLNLEQDIPDYDMDSGDESWVNSQSKRLDLSYYKFEQMMDRLEKSSGQTVVTLNEAKALLKQDDEVSIAVYDYWLHKRLKTQHPLILTVKTENRGGIAANSPYLAFRRRTEKMQTRKNRKNDEASYEKMLKLRRDLSRAVTLLEMIKKREKTKREQLHLTIEVVEKRYQARDFSGQLQAEYQAQVAKSATRPAFAPLYSNQYGQQQHHQGSPQHQWTAERGGGGGVNHHYVGGVNKRDLDSMNNGSSGGNGGGGGSRKEKRQYKKRKHKHTQREKQRMYSSPGPAESMVSSEEEDLCNVQASESEDEGPFGFKRNKCGQYNMPVQNGFGNWPWTSRDENGAADPRYRFTLTSLAHPRPRCIGFARRRIGRGGRVIIDRMSTDMDELWSRLDYKIFDSARRSVGDDNNPPLSTEEDSGCVVAALDEPQTQKRLVDLTSCSGSSNSNNNNISGSHNSGSSSNRGANGPLARSSIGADVVIKSEGGVGHPTTNNSGSSLSIVLEGPAVPLSQASSSLDRCSSSGASSGYFSQQQSLGGGGVTASASLDAVGLMRGTSSELTRSLSLPLSTGALIHAFQDVSGSPALLRRSSTAMVVVAAATEKEREAEKESRVPSVVDCGGGDSVDNEDDMSLAELARKSGPCSRGGEQSEDELFAMIRKEWLHFRPTAKEGDTEGESELPKISSMAPLNLEVVTLRTDGEGVGHHQQQQQMGAIKDQEPSVVLLDVDLPSSVFLNSEDNLYQPQPFALDDLCGWRGESAHSSADSSLAASPMNGDRSGGGGGGLGGGGNLLDQSLSGDSLNELSLNLGDGDDEAGEKVLENILQECQMGDFKILEDPTLFTGLADTDEEQEGEEVPRDDASQLRNLFDRAVGYESEFVSWAMDSLSAGSGKRRRRDTVKSGGLLRAAGRSSKERLRRRRRLSCRVGKSRFQLSRVVKRDETFSPEKMGSNGGGGGTAAGQTNGVPEVVLDEVDVVGGGGVVTIKQEPDVAMEDGVMQVHEIKVEKQEEVVLGEQQEVVVPGTTTTTLMVNAGGLQQQQMPQQRTAATTATTTRNIIFQGGTNYLAQQGENTIILTSSLNAVKGHLNGPMTEKTLASASSPAHKSIQFKRQQLTPKLSDGTTTTILNNGGGALTPTTVVTSAGAQKFSLTTVGPNQLPKTISIAGQPGTAGNKFYIHQGSLVNAAQHQQQITLTGSGGTVAGNTGQVLSSGATKSLQYLTPANIKFNFTGGNSTGSSAGGGGGVSVAQGQDIKSLLASSLPSSIIINDQQQQQQQQQGQQVVTGQQQRKTMNVYVDAEKRFLYTNNRGQFVAQLNAKMVNVVPMQTASGGGGAQAPAGGQQQQVLAATSSTSNSNTKIITTTTAKGMVHQQQQQQQQQAMLDGTSRIITTTQQQGGATRGFPTVQRLRPIRSSVQQQQQLQNAIAKHNSQVVVTAGSGGGGGGAGEVRTFNRILFQAAPQQQQQQQQGQGVATTSVTIGDPIGGGGSGTTSGGGIAEGSINVNSSSSSSSGGAGGGVGGSSSAINR